MLARQNRVAGAYKHVMFCRAFFRPQAPLSNDPRISDKTGGCLRISDAGTSARWAVVE